MLTIDAKFVSSDGKFEAIKSSSLHSCLSTSFIDNIDIMITVIVISTIMIIMLIIIIIKLMMIIIDIDDDQVLSLVSPLRLLLLPDDWKQLEGHVEAREETPIFIYNSRCLLGVFI